MQPSFFSRLTERIRTADSLLCVGLDPHPEFLSQSTANEAGGFCRRIIEETSDLACAFKPNSAFFETFGGAGIQALRRVIEAVPEGIPVILDAKRGDIASTARAYAQAAFHVLGADALTVNPYLGWDSVEPILADPYYGAFLLCKTSNPGSADFQDRIIETGEPLYSYFARQAQGRVVGDNLGLVVGATDTQALLAVRRAAPDLWILAPGIGAQGGNLENALRAGLRKDGMGILFPVSRAIALAQDRREETQRLRDRINVALGRAETDQVSIPFREVADGLLEVGCVKFGSFTLKSGVRSPIYIDLRLLASFPRLLAKVAGAYQTMTRHLKFDRWAALPYAALPIGTALSLQSGIPLIYPRKEIKAYGTRASVEGHFNSGESVLVIDDLITSAGSKVEAISKLEAAGLVVQDVVVLIDRQSGGAHTLESAGYHLHRIFTLEALLDYWESSGKVASGQAKEVREFLRGQAN